MPRMPRNRKPETAPATAMVTAEDRTIMAEVFQRLTDGGRLVFEMLMGIINDPAATVAQKLRASRMVLDFGFTKPSAAPAEPTRSDVDEFDVRQLNREDARRYREALQVIMEIEARYSGGGVDEPEA